MESIITNFDKGIISRYMYEQLEFGNISLPIMSRCSGNCFFCSNKQNPFKIYSEPPRHLIDVKMGITALKTNINKLDISHVKKLSEGEACQHPHFFQILYLIRKKFPFIPITFYTNGTKLTEEFIKELSKFKPINILISFHSANKENWIKIFRIKESYFDICYNSIKLLKKYDIYTLPSIVPIPKLVGNDDIEKTVKYLSKFCNSIYFYSPGFNKFSNDETKDLLNVDIPELSKLISKISKKYKVTSEFLNSSLMPSNFYPYNIMNDTASINKNVLWMFSEAAYNKNKEILSNYAKNISNNHYAAMVKNHTYGGNITCSGLLMVDDFRKTLKLIIKKIPNIDLVILPNTAFNSFGQDLCVEPFSNLEEEFGINVMLG